MKNNGLMIQYVEGKDAENTKLWKKAAEDAAALCTAGITSVWLPPAYKGANGAEDSGYTVYDLYDLGEFDQKGSVATKYGTKDEYIEAVEAFHKKGIQVYADVAISQRTGADEIENVPVDDFNARSRFQMVGKTSKIGAKTKFTFPGRKGAYSDFTWNWTHFGGIDWNLKEEGYDYMISPVVDFTNREVYDELVRWAVWYVKTTGVDGFRLDNVSDIPASFYRDFLYQVRTSLSQELFTAGSYWQWDVNAMNAYLEEIHSEASLFDAPLHYNFHNCSKAHGSYDLRTLLDGTLSAANAMKAVTFVDNQDTVVGGMRESAVEDWFKPMAYAMILLRNEGYPCVYGGDFFAEKGGKKSLKSVLDKLMKLRKTKAYGAQHDYFDNPDCIGWTREGDDAHKDSGLAVVISDGAGGTKHMYIGRQFAGMHFSDILGNAKYNIRIDEYGFGDFYVNRDSVAVWVHKEPKAVKQK